MSGSIIKTKRRGGEGIALNDAIGKTDLSNLFLGPVRKADLPSRHHLNDETLNAKGEAVYFHQLVQEVVVHVIVRFLEVVDLVFRKTKMVQGESYEKPSTNG